MSARQIQLPPKRLGTSSNNTVTVPPNLDKNQVLTANIQVAQKFGLVVDDLTSAEVITSDKNTVNDYGIPSVVA